MDFSSLADQVKYLNQRLNVMQSFMSKQNTHQPVANTHQPPPKSHTVAEIHTTPITDAPKRGRGRPTGPAKLYSLRAAYQIFVERGLIVKRGRGRPRKSA